MKIMVLDAEIKKAIPSKKEAVIPGIEYCDGWNDHANMGISVMGVYDYPSKRSRVFCDDNRDEFFELCNQSDLIVSFNGVNFDSKLIEAVWDYEIPASKHYDVLRKIWVGVGIDPDQFNYGSHTGYGLQDMAQVNLGRGKSGNGALAPVEWQQGKVGSVIDYCLDDIALTVGLFDLIRDRGYLICPKTGRNIEIIG